ncbi:MAG: Trehalose/maltose import ATP-binding protein MalK [Methanosaeta sp. PtaU1.Bin112]|nr:MAG: Trehalose/maltose import ATP-binding protein MalK [Methanosaeta sp. PtaU1.Bin112]
MSLLEIRGLFIDYYSDRDAFRAVDDLNLTLERGEVIGLAGESGSGKTTLGLAIMGLLPDNVRSSGSILFQGEDLVAMQDSDKDRIRWRHIAMVFQNSLEVLNPVIRMVDQVSEPMIEHLGLGKEQARARCVRLFEQVGLDSVWLDAYPHQLSGGMRQRALLAMALSCDPDILILDEVTSALDAFTKKEISDLLCRLQKTADCSMILISHDITFLSAVSTRMAVLYAGRIMELGATSEIINYPMHPYTRGLINSTPGIFLYRDLWGIPGEAPSGQVRGCPFFGRCTQRVDLCSRQPPRLLPVRVPASAEGMTVGSSERDVACHLGGVVTLLRASGLNYSYRLSDGKLLDAVKDVSLDLREGEVMAVVGQTGSGKSTLAHMLAGVMGSDVGEIFFDGKKMNGDRYGSGYGGIQIVFQDPASSTSSRLSVLDAVKEPLDINGLHSPRERIELVASALSSVGLPTTDEFLRRHCGELSGGQRQRVAIARALIMRPKLLIADEITASLDVSSAANILRMLKGLQNCRGFAMIYITHDLMIALKASDRIAVMDGGRIIETGNSHYVMLYPRQEATKRLVGARIHKSSGGNCI